MLKARTLTVLINRPIDDVYGFLTDPTNLGRWTLAKAGQPVPAEGPMAWSFSGPAGPVLVRFGPTNPYHVLDYSVQTGVHVWQSCSIRLIRNGNGCVLVHTAVQQKLVSDAAFESEAMWLEADLLVLKTLMER